MSSCKNGLEASIQGTTETYSVEDSQSETLARTGQVSMNQCMSAESLKLTYYNMTE